LTNHNSSLEEEYKSKCHELQNSEQSCISVMKVLEDNKKSLKNLKYKLKKKEEEEAQNKLIYAEKDQEIHFLKNFINSLKNELQSKNFDI